MDCRITCFDRVIHLTQKLPANKLEEAVELITEYSFMDLLEFCVDNKCFTKEQSNTLYDFIIVWEDLDGNYYEEDYDKLSELYEAIGVTEEVYNKYLRESD